MAHWSIITGEYPPQRGGVSDYTKLVAEGLISAGDQVHVFTPGHGVSRPIDSPITVHQMPGVFDIKTIRYLNHHLRHNVNRSILLVQYVPHAFGFKGLNVAFCLWLYSMRRAGIVVNFHEVAYPFSLAQPVRHNLLAAVNRAMALLVARSASKIFVTTPAWLDLVRRLAGASELVTWLPVPSTLPVVPNGSSACLQIRNRYASAHSLVVGHFGTYGSAITDRLGTCLKVLLDNDSERCALLIGRNSKGFRDSFVTRFPRFAHHVHAAGELEPKAVSEHMAACDVMLQPYPDGITTRRTSAMCALALGMPVVTNGGHLTEQLWRDSNAVSLCTDETLAQGVEQLLADKARRYRLGIDARQFYIENFDVQWTIAALKTVALSARSHD